MDEQTAFLLLVTERLDALGVVYMLSGSVALNVYAEPRMTRDIDIVVDMIRAHVDPFVAAFDEDCYVDREMVRDAVARRDMFNIIHEEWVMKADFIVRKSTPYRIRELQRRRVIRIEDREVAVVSPEDLLLSKLVWGRSGSELQRRDVDKLVRHVPSLDWAYVERWAPELRVDAVVRELRGER